MRRVPLAELKTEDAVKKTFDPAYPERSGGDAWVNVAGDKITIENSNENRDIDQPYDLPLAEDGVRRVSGTIHLHTYIVAKSSDAGHTLWLQANSHHITESRAHGRFVVEAPIRDTEITFDCARPPKVTVAPPDALVSRQVADWEGYLGRPQVLMRGGHPAYLFVAQHGGQYGRSTGTVLRCVRR
jgi:hypothetical protein